ncbi:MAG: zinc-dependent alcohol dehydrogenase [Spirochaetaceae bacterium]
MSALVIRAPQQAEVTDYDPPDPAEGECLVRVLAAGIGPSDLHVYRGDYRDQRYPRIPGLDVLGVVETCSGALTPVRRVVISQSIPCGICRACVAGERERCYAPGLLGRDRDGGMRSWMPVSSPLLLPAPEDLSDDRAACVPETAYGLSLAAQATEEIGERMRSAEDAYIVIFGAGFLGIVTALAVAEAGCRPILVDVVQARLELARSLGIRDTCNPLREFVGEQVHWITRRHYAAAAVVVSEDTEVVLTAPSVLRPGGRLLLTGHHPDSMLPVNALIANSVEVRGAVRTQGFFAEAAGFIRRHGAAYEELISLVLEPESLPQALTLLADEPKSYMKIICRLH